jgi:hypothetical protein
LQSKSSGTETYSSIILPVVVWGCVNWSPTLREEVLRKVHGLKSGRHRILEKIAQLWALFLTVYFPVFKSKG